MKLFAVAWFFIFLIVIYAFELIAYDISSILLQIDITLDMEC